LPNLREIPVAAHDVFMDLVLTETRQITGRGSTG
jgi:5-formyltetrahydrofolate cyclo-ligase